MQGSRYTPIGFKVLCFVIWTSLAAGCLPGQTKAPVQEADAGPDIIDSPGACNPATQSGCERGEKCASVVESENPRLSRTTCVPDGTQQLDEECERGPEGAAGYDNCAGGLSCNSGFCAAICVTGPADSCRSGDEALGEGSNCTVFADLFQEGIGLCVPACDPSDDDACAPGYGCYVDAQRGVASCAAVPPAAADLAQNADCYGPASGDCYLNGCSPGHTPLLSNKTENADGVLCSRYCTPQESHATSLDAVFGVNGNCEAAALSQSGGTSGNNSTHQCRFVQSFYDNTEYLPASLGMCVPVMPSSGGSWGDCTAFDWEGIRSTWDDAVEAGSDPVAAFRAHCLESPADPTNSPVFDQCMGLFRGCISISEAEQVLQIPTGGALMSRRSWIATLGFDRPNLGGWNASHWREQD